jgi:hypothetical protein
MRVAVPVVLALVVAGCLQPGPPPVVGDGDGATTIPAFTMEGKACRELIAQAAIPVAAARVFVPAKYKLLGEATGQATMFAGLKVCADLALDNASVGPGSTSDVGVLIEAPDGSGGLHYYQTWWITDNAALGARLDAMGWNASVVEGTKLEDARVAPLGVGSLRYAVPWSAGAYSAEATLAGGTVTGTLDATGWEEGVFGPVRVTKTLASTESGAGRVTLTTAPGSPMARLLGGAASADGPALWNVYAMKGRVTPAKA